MNTPNLSEFLHKVIECESPIQEPLAEAGPFTLFAPQNAAFTAIEEELKKLTKDDLCDLLKRHIVKGKEIMEDEFKDETLKTLNGDLKVTKNGDKTKFGEVMASIVQGMGDKKATNGIVHTIDKVLLEITASK